MKFNEVKIRYKRKIKYENMPTIDGGDKVYNYIKGVYENIDYIECLYAIYLTRCNKALGYSLISKGGISQTVVDQRIIFQQALLMNASSIILVHNHPSGSLIISNSDIEITNKIIKGANILSFNVLDHVIVSSEGYVSMNDKGLIG